MLCNIILQLSQPHSRTIGENSTLIKGLVGELYAFMCNFCSARMNGIMTLLESTGCSGLPRPGFGAW